MAKKHIAVGVALTTLLLIIHLAIIDEYGITWDFHHHFFAGLYHLGIPINEALTKNIPFTVPDPRGTYDLPFGPLMTIAPVITYQLFHEWLGLLAFDNAYHLSIILSGVAGIFILYLFLLEAFGVTTAIAGFAFLALLPRYFGDLHNNMKDVPQAAAFTLAIYTFWRLATYKRLKDLILASIAFAIAFNTKVNTLFVPVIAGVWITIITVINFIEEKKLRFSLPIFLSSHLPILLYFLLAPLTAFLLWLPFWQHPIERLQYMFRFFLDNTQNLEVLYFGTVYKSAINVPWHYPLGYLAVTTPLPILIFFIVGLIGILIQLLRRIFNFQFSIFNENFKFQISNLLLLLLWFFLPLARYLNPKIGVIDGIRHFEEVVFPLAAIAAVGAVSLYNHYKHYNRYNRYIAAAIAAALIMPIVRYHPYQISYFNELVGGIRGAWKNFDVEYWGTSQKAAMRWLNANAPEDSYVHIVMAPDAAAKYLRPDLLARVNQRGFAAADYVVLLNRQSFFARYWGITDYMTGRRPLYTVNVDGVPLTYVYGNRPQ